MKRKTNTQGKGMYCPVCGRGKIFKASDAHEAAQIFWLCLLLFKLKY